MLLVSSMKKGKHQMRTKWFKLFSLLMVIALVLPLSVAVAAAPMTDGPVATVPAGIPSTHARYIVQLEGVPLAAYYQQMGQVRSMSTHGRLDVHTAASQAYIRKLQEKQMRTFQLMKAAVPGIRMAEYRDALGKLHPLTYQIVLNGFAVRLPKASREVFIRLSHVPGVKLITVEHRIVPNLDIVNPQIGSPAVWAALGGVANSGAGLKVAVIDTGIDPQHPFFDPTGYSYPAGFPKGDTRYTTPKVIVMRGYYRPDDPPIAPAPKPGNPHGVGTAGAVAGNANTIANVNGVEVPVSGVAPAAYLMSYQIFYPAADNDGVYASDPETVKAIEDMVADGADVSNNSWGENAFVPLKDGYNPVIDALNNASKAGVVVVKSAGNSGRGGEATVGGNDQPYSAISVGATDSTRAFGNEAAVVAPEPVPDNLKSILASPAEFGPALSADFGPAKVISVGRVDSGNGRACSAITDPNGLLNGNIALISRGLCTFVSKVKHAQAAGAVLVVVYNNVKDAPPITMGGTSTDITIPSFMVSNMQGLALDALENANPGEVQMTISAKTSRILNVNAPDIMTDFSSRGPGYPLNRIIPDVVAIGQKYLTSYSLTGGWDVMAGTSFSGPTVAGAATLLRSVHPNWTPAEIKSALMTTAKTQVYDDYGQTTLAGVMERGSGRIQVDKAMTPGLTVDSPSHSFGLVDAGSTTSFTVHATSVADTDLTWNISVMDPMTVGFSSSITSLALPAGGTGSFDVMLNVPSNMAAGDYEGSIELTSGDYSAHIPLWVRVKAEKTPAKVLLIDDDGSLLQPAFFGVATPDYRSYFTMTLDAMGVSYDVWEADRGWYFGPSGLPDIATLQKYDKVIWFTGDSFLSYYDIAADPASRDRLLDYFHNTPNAKLFVTGQDWSGYFSSWQSGTDAGCVLCSLGVGNWAEDAYAPAKMPTPPAVSSAIGEGPFANMILDLGGVISPTLPSPDGRAGNQNYVDGLSPDTSAWTGVGLFRSLVPADKVNQAAVPYIATGRGGEPMLETHGQLTTSDSRAIYFAFGLEGVPFAFGMQAQDGGNVFVDRTTVMRRVFDWLDDQVSVTVADATSELPAIPVTFVANANSSKTDGFTYRWDFGDGSSIVSSGDSMTTSHTYAAAGTYPVMVEATDAFGHKAVASAMATVNPGTPPTPATASATFRQGLDGYNGVKDTYIDSTVLPWSSVTQQNEIVMRVRQKNVKSALLYFDVSSIPANATIKSATLKVYASYGSLPNLLLSGYALKKPWDVNTANWWNASSMSKWEMAGANGSGDRDSTPFDSALVKAGGWVTLDATALVQSWVSGSNYGLILRGDNAAPKTEWQIISSDFSNPALRPTLEVTYDYIP